MINLKERLSKDYFINYCSQIKIYFLLALLLMIAGFLIGLVFADIFQPVMDMLLNNMANSSIPNVSEFQQILSNNVKANILVILGGILFSIFSAFSLLLNAILIGYVASTIPFARFVLLVVPHGIFEIPAILLAGSTAFMITHVIIRCIKGIFSKDLTLREEFSKSRNLIEAIIVSIIIILVLLVIAAFIEANITVGIAKFILSFIS